MNSPTSLETSMVRHMTENEYMTSGQLAMHCCKPEHEITMILDRWEDTGYVARLDEEHTLTR